MTDAPHIAPEMLMAYADGELDPLNMKRVEKAMAADPAIAAQVERHRALAASLQSAFAPLEAAPVPPAIAAMLAQSARVTPMRAPSAPMRRERPIWMGAIAASLVAGLLAGPFVLPQGGSDIAIENGQPVARGEVARALDTQLASTQGSGAAVRIGVTFRDGDNRLCRTFERGATGGIACANGGQWQLQRLYGGIAQQGTAYRQAASPAAAMMADAQAMMRGAPLDAQGEAAALKAR